MQPTPDTVKVVETLKLAIILLKEHSGKATTNALAIPMDQRPTQTLAEGLLLQSVGINTETCSWTMCRQGKVWSTQS